MRNRVMKRNEDLVIQAFLPVFVVLNKNHTGRNAGRNACATNTPSLVRGAGTKGNARNSVESRGSRVAHFMTPFSF